MASMTVGLDIDVVVADFITPFLKLLETHSGSVPIDPASITDPNFVHHPFLTRDIIFRMHKSGILRAGVAEWHRCYRLSSV